MAQARRKIVGRFCRRKLAAAATFAPGSFRWIHRGRNWILIGCPKGRWMPRARRCAVGTRAHELLIGAPKTGKCCKGKGICIKKG